MPTHCDGPINIYQTLFFYLQNLGLLKLFLENDLRCKNKHLSCIFFAKFSYESKRYIMLVLVARFHS